MLDTRGVISDYRDALEGIEWFYDNGDLDEQGRHFAIAWFSGMFVAKQSELMFQNQFENIFGSVIKPNSPKWQGLMLKALRQHHYNYDSASNR